MPPSGVIPAEDWPPYRWVWTRFGPTNPETGERHPFTHGARWSPLGWVLFMLLVMGWLVWGARGSWWRVLLAFALGFLAGHFWWVLAVLYLGPGQSPIA